jgi:hypothetical protein
MSCLAYAPLALSPAHFTHAVTCDPDHEVALIIRSIMDAYLSRMASDRIKHQIDAMLEALPPAKNEPEEQPMD